MKRKKRLSLLIVLVIIFNFFQATASPSVTLENEKEDIFYPVVMTDFFDGSIQTINNKDETLTTGIFGNQKGYVAGLRLEGYDGEIGWETSDSSLIIVSGEEGRVFLKKAGTVTVTALEDEGFGEEIQSFDITVEVPDAFELTLKVGDVDYTNKTYAISEESDIEIFPWVSVDGGVSKPVFTKLFTWFSDNTSVARVYADGYVEPGKESGTATISTSLGDISASMMVTTSYVVTTGIESQFGGEYEIHGRNPNSIGQNDTPGVASFNPLRNNGGEVGSEFHIARVTPENATYAKNYLVTSHNNEILSYKKGMQNSLLPLKEGTVDITVTSEDPKLSKQVSDVASITLKYFNPLTSLKVENDTLILKKGEVIDAGLIFKGPKSDMGYHVTESNMTWEQRGDGQVTPYRSYPVIMINDDKYITGEGTVSNDQWLIRGNKEGTVQLIGTPVDSGNGAQAITLNITVMEGDLIEARPANERVDETLNNTATYQLEKMPIHTFGSEWSILGLARAEYSVGDLFYDTYYASVYDQVAKEISKETGQWDNKITETQRLALALTAIGKDPRDVNGVNLLDYSWNKEDKFPGNGEILGDRQGSNELIFALLAVEAHHDFTEPHDASITVDGMVNKLLSDFQIPDGGFGLHDHQTLSVDLTAMAIQALAKHIDKAHVKAAIDKAIIKLATMQGVGDGSFGNAESTSQVIVALTELGIDPDEDPRFKVGGISLLDGFLRYANEEGSFAKTIGGKANPIATEQALYALAAMKRFYTSTENSFYDMRDVVLSKDTGDLRVADIQLFPLTREIKIGGNSQLTATVIPASAVNKNVTWYSSNQAVASVDDSGLVTGISSGKATITVMTDEGNKTATAVITIKKSETAVPGKELYVTLSVDKQAINKGYVINPTKVEIYPGDTVWNVLRDQLDKQGINYRYSDSSQYNSVYIESIDGDGEFDHGPGSGWKCSIDGVYVEHSASAHELYGGERIKWRYTTNLGGDLDDDPSLGQLVPERDFEADKDGNVKVVVSDGVINKALEKAVSEESEHIVVHPTIKGESTSINIQLTRHAVTAIGDKGKSLKIETPLGSMTLKSEALKHLPKGKEIAFMMKNQSTGGIEIGIQVDDQMITNIKGGLKVTLPGGETAGKVLVLFNEDGTKAIFKKSLPTKKGLAALLLGSATVKIIDNAKLFEDIGGGYWAADTIKFVSARNLLSGMSENIFSPNLPMTRGMLVSVLHRLENNGESRTPKAFEDVAEDAWYANSVAWAAGEGIIVGTGKGFSPNDSITREQLATILYRYVGYLDLDSSVTGDLTLYNDQDQVSTWAKETVSWAVGAELIRGKEGSLLDPKGVASRVEVATVLMRIIEMIIQ